MEHQAVAKINELPVLQMVPGLQYRMDEFWKQIWGKQNRKRPRKTKYIYIYFQNTFIKAEAVNKEGPRTEEAIGETRWGCFGSLETLWESSECRWGCCQLTGESEKRLP